MSVSLVLAGLLTAGCSASGGDAASTSAPAPALDCAAAQFAMDDYSVALADLATSLEAGDAMSAVAAADAMSYSLDQLEVSLPGIPQEGQAFLTASRAVALQVKQSAADSPEMTGLLGELTAAFGDPAFAEGGAAIDAFVDQVCPGASPSAS
jgi:hypothetical protein